SSRRRHTRFSRDWSSDVCSSDLFRDTRPEIFLNAMAFEGKWGYVLGDPIDGYFQLLRTKDKGKTWENISHEMLLFADKGEVAFADRKSTRLNSSHVKISYAVFCL